MTRRPAKPVATPATAGVIRPAMSLDQLDRRLRTPRKLQAVADSLAMLDGFVTAIVAGPVTYEPLGWLCPLLGVIKDACLNSDTPEFAAIAAVAEHHNVISVESAWRITSECCWASKFERLWRTSSERWACSSITPCPTWSTSKSVIDGAERRLRCPRPEICGDDRQDAGAGRQ